MATTPKEPGQGSGYTNEGANRVQGTMGDLSETVGRAGQRAADATSRAASFAREGVDRLSSAASSTVDRVAESAQDTVQQVTDSATEYAGRLSATGEHLIEDARDYIAANPLRTILIAAGAGFLIARMLR